MLRSAWNFKTDILLFPISRAVLNIGISFLPVQCCMMCTQNSLPVCPLQLWIFLHQILLGCTGTCFLHQTGSHLQSRWDLFETWSSAWLWFPFCMFRARSLFCNVTSSNPLCVCSIPGCTDLHHSRSQSHEMFHSNSMKSKETEPNVVEVQHCCLLEKSFQHRYSHRLYGWIQTFYQPEMSNYFAAKFVCRNSYTRIAIEVSSCASVRY